MLYCVVAFSAKVADNELEAQKQQNAIVAGQT